MVFNGVPPPPPPPPTAPLFRTPTFPLETWELVTLQTKENGGYRRLSSC